MRTSVDRGEQEQNWTMYIIWTFSQAICHTNDITSYLKKDWGRAGAWGSRGRLLSETLLQEKAEREKSVLEGQTCSSHTETPNLTLSTKTPLLIHGRLSFSQPDQGCQAVWRFQSFFPREGRGWGFGFNVIGMSVMASLAYRPDVCCRWHGRQ